MLIAGVLGACGGDGPSSSSSPDADRRGGDAERISASLCRSLRASHDGDVAIATERFDEVHGSLHSLAATLTPMDRSLAGRFLESKAAVEANLDGDAAELSSALDSLIQMTSQAAATLGTTVSACTR